MYLKNTEFLLNLAKPRYLESEKKVCQFQTTYVPIDKYKRHVLQAPQDPTVLY